MMIETQRIYSHKKDGKGYRILVDRLWPRGIKKTDVRLDLWMKDVGPSNELRKWFGHDPSKWPEFRKRYFSELKGHGEDVQRIIDAAKDSDVVLLFGAKDEDHNQAVALKEYVERRMKK